MTRFQIVHSRFEYPQPLFETRISDIIRYAVSRDGQTFLIPTMVESGTQSATVVINWTAGIKR